MVAAERKADTSEYVAELILKIIETGDAEIFAHEKHQYSNACDQGQDSGFRSPSPQVPFLTMRRATPKILQPL